MLYHTQNCFADSPCYVTLSFQKVPVGFLPNRKMSAYIPSKPLPLILCLRHDDSHRLDFHLSKVNHTESRVSLSCWTKFEFNFINLANPLSHLYRTIDDYSKPAAKSIVDTHTTCGIFVIKEAPTMNETSIPPFSTVSDFASSFQLIQTNFYQRETSLGIMCRVSFASPFSRTALSSIFFMSSTRQLQVCLNIGMRLSASRSQGPAIW